MSIPGITLITYVWHYLVARVVYDQLVRPLSHGHASWTLVVGGIAAVAFVAGRWSARHRAHNRKRRAA